MKAVRIFTFISTILVFILHLIGTCLFKFPGDSDLLTGFYLFEGGTQIVIFVFLLILIILILVNLFQKQGKLITVLSLLLSFSIMIVMVISMFVLDNTYYSFLNSAIDLYYGLNEKLIYSAIGFSLVIILFNFINVILTFKSKNIETSKSTKASNLSEDTQELEDRFSRGKEVENNHNFTSTPTDGPNAHDMIAKLRQSLATENIQNANVTNPEEIKTIEPSTQELNQEILNVQREIDELNQERKKIEEPTVELNEKESQVVSVESVVYDNSPKDPYSQTIVPRRAANKAVKFEQPIGNRKLSENQNFRERNAKFDESYQGKVFIGDSDRIWEAMKKKERNLGQDEVINKEVVSVINESVKTPVKDPLSSNNGQNNDSPTIDWDE